MSTNKFSQLVKFVTLITIGLLTACVPAGPRISVSGVWGRPSPKVAEASAFYMTIRNSGSQLDRLTAVRSSQCGAAELHESYQTSAGAMGMRPVAGGVIEVPAGGTVELKAGGLHVMCLQRKGNPQSGSRVPVTLIFEQSGEIQAEAEIKEQ